MPGLRIMWIKVITDPVILLCPHLPKQSSVHRLHVNVLQMYHAALANHLIFYIVQYELKGEDMGYVSRRP